MKRTFKKVISTFLALAIMITCLPMMWVKIEAANTVQERIEYLRSVYPNTYGYFSVSGGPCTDWTHAHEGWCNNCLLNSIPSRGGLPAGWEVGLGEWYSCASFAVYAYYCIHGHNHLSNTSYPSTMSYGDLVHVYLNDYYQHWFIYLGEDSNNYCVFDANSDYTQKVVYNRVISKSAYANYTKTIYHSTSDEQTPPAPGIEYSAIQPGTYFLINKYDGKALTLGNNEDWNTNNVHAYQTAASNRGQYMVISAAPDGCKIRPIDSTRLVQPYGDHVYEGANVNIYDDVNDSSQWWKFEKTDGGYYIRNTQNTNLLLTNSFPNDCNAVIWSYSGGNDQIWDLVPAVAPGKPVVKGVKSSYNQSESVVVDWDDTSDTNCYNIALERKENGVYKEIYWKENISHSCNLNSVVDLQPGDYRVRLASVNTKLKADYGENSYYLSTIGDYVNFTVKEKAGETKGTIRIDDVNVSSEQTFALPIYVDGEKIKAVTYIINYDPDYLNLLQESSSDKSVFALSSWVVDKAAGTITISSMDKDASYNGKIEEISFKAKSGKQGSTKISLTVKTAGDSNGNEIYVNGSEASVTINGFKRGDLNKNGAIDVLDALLALKASSGNIQLTSEQIATADINGNGYVDVLDALTLLKASSGEIDL